MSERLPSVGVSFLESDRLLTRRPPVPADPVLLGDVTRFASPGQLCSWAGLTPRHRASDTKVHRGPITKQGSPLLRWACVEAVQRCSADTPMRRLKDRITQRRGSGARNTAKTAAARKLLTLVYYALRDGEVRCLAKTATA